MIKKEPFGTSPCGRQITLYTLTNRNGMTAKIMDFGATLVSLTTPDRNGNFADVILGYDKADDYFSQSSYHGATIGRFGNRIANGKFSLDGVEYTLPQNDGTNSLHGGTKGFSHVMWDGSENSRSEGPSITFKLVSEDGDQGYPGALYVSTIYTLTEENSLKIEYVAESDKKTVINMTHHSYFNLAGAMSGGHIKKHQLYIDAAAITPIDEKLIPTGDLMPVANTPLDFNKLKEIGCDIDSDHEQIRLCGGFDHNYVLNDRDHMDAPAVIALDPESGRRMQVFTSQVALQFYSGNFAQSKPGKGNIDYQLHCAFCIEPQHYPDSPNKPQFPTTVLNPREKYYEVIVYKFDAIN